MDSSDDYIFDDIVLDDQALAILDQSEQKHLKETSAAFIPGVPAEPVNKRLKTATGWIPGTGAAQTVEEELPEISLQGDGTYGVTRQARYMKDVGQGSFPRTRQINTPARASILSNDVGQAANQSTQSPGSHLPNSRSAYPINNRQRQQHATIYGQNHNRNSRVVKDQDSQRSPVLAQLTALQQKLDELREENSKMKTALQEAVDTKLAKDGEVSILRKNIEKNALNHAAQILQIRAEKEKADTKQLQMQKEMKDEIERLRTQFLFRQQELESTVRRPPASVRAKKLGRDFPSTPLALPSAISGWSKAPPKPIEETPIRPARLPSAFNRMSPTKPRKSPEKIKNGMLPGFENAFETSTPRKSPSKKIARVKEERIIEPPIFGPETKNDLRLPSQLSQGPSQFQFEPLSKQTESHEIFTLRQPSRSASSEQSQVNDIEMDVAPMESDEDIVPEELEILQPTNWKAELCRIILTHSYGPTEEISFQQILASSNLSTSVNDYTASCGTILEVISNPSRSDDRDGWINSVSTSFLSLLTMSSDIHSQSNLIIIFDLLTKLVTSIPTFRTSLLSCRLPFEENRPSTIIEVICSTILNYLQPAMPQREDSIAGETLAFLDSLCFHVDGQAMERLEPLARNRETLMVLLHPSQTSWFLERSSRLLLLLSTYHELYKVLLDISDGGNLNGDVQMKDALFERLCSHLIDTDKPPSSTFKAYILTYFGQLSISHSGALGVLGASYALIPSLVLYISQLTSPLWEDDGSLACSTETTSSTVKALNQATFLLYHLIFGIEPNHNLRYTLQHAPHRPFNCISHIFVVTFGRLSYSEPPNWIEASKRQELEFLAEIAREILEVVVDGPEGDSVWAAFQNEPDEDKIDEEDMEAQLMGNAVG